MATGNVNSIKVRMYRHGFGDCFLLSFFHDSERVFSMVVDCGIKHNTKSDDVPIAKVIDDLKKTLTPAGGGKPVIDVLVATHEHWDHIAFFHPTESPDYFSEFDIRQVWLAWTEDPTNDEAIIINSRLREGAAALQVASFHLQDSDSDAAQFQGMYFGGSVARARSKFTENLGDVLGFYGLALSKKSKNDIRYNEDGKISVQTEVAMKNIVKMGNLKGGIKYFKPGTSVESQHLPPGVNVFVLGPPCNSQINKSNPSSGKAHETYFGIDHTGLTGFIDGVLELGASPKSKSRTPASVGPFGKGIGIPSNAAESDPWFQATYLANDEAYRRIDNSWLDAVGQFSLQLDGAINNTSLVLAIELEQSKKILLFPGDAQVGSWLSWHDYEWTVQRGDKTETLTAKEILNNTVLYKVSHHGSHNATVKEKGLELMKHPELVAMIPEKEESYNGILYQPLLDRLNELCKGRVLVSADVNHTPEELVKKRPTSLTAAEWKSFKSDLNVDRLYVEYTIR